MAWVPCGPNFRVLGRLPQVRMRMLIVLAAASEVLKDLHAAVFFRLVRPALISFPPCRIAALFVPWAELRVPASEVLGMVCRRGGQPCHFDECVSASHVRSKLRNEKSSHAVGKLITPTIIHRTTVCV